MIPTTTEFLSALKRLHETGQSQVIGMFTVEKTNQGWTLSLTALQESHEFAQRAAAA